MNLLKALILYRNDNLMSISTNGERVYKFRVGH